MNQPQDVIFNQLLLAITMGYPWVINPKKLEWIGSDTVNLMEFLVENKIIFHLPRDISQQSSIRTIKEFTIGFEHTKVTKYRIFYKDHYYNLLVEFNSYLQDKSDEPKQITPKTRPSLP